MYLDHFGLTANPFGLSPHLGFLYKSSAFEESIAHLIYGVNNNEAIIMITGAIGSGKTMAVQSFLTNIGPNFTSALVTNTRVDSLELLKLILEDLDVSFDQGCDKSDVLIHFKDFLISENDAGRRVLIVIDEAQNLKTEVLEEIRLLTNLGQGEKQPVQLVLLGQPELADNVQAEGLAQLRQRIRIHYHLDTLNRKELEEYINHRLEVAGCTQKVFHKKALDLIYELSGGIPRLVNSLAGNALLSAYVADRHQVLKKDIDPNELLGFQDLETNETKAAAETFVKPTTQEKAKEEAFVYTKPRRKRKRLNPVFLWLPIVLAIGVGTWFFSRKIDFGGSPKPPKQVGDWAESQKTSGNSLVPETVRNEGTPTEVATENAEEASRVEEPSRVEESSKVPDEVSSLVVDNNETNMPLEDNSSAQNQPEPAAILEDAFEVKIASFKTWSEAQAMVSRMEALTNNVFSRKNEVGGTSFHSVFLGPFGSEKEAGIQAKKISSTEPILYYKIGKQ